MIGVGTISIPIWFPPRNGNPSPRIHFPTKENQNPTFSSFSLGKESKIHTDFSPKASSSSFFTVSEEYIEETATNVKFQSSLNLPGCPNPLSLLGTGYREKVFAIIGVKVYAAGLYINESVFSKLSAWRGLSAAEIQGNVSLFSSIYQDPLEKALQIVLVRDVDGKTFWDALPLPMNPLCPHFEESFKGDL